MNSFKKSFLGLLLVTGASVQAQQWVGTTNTNDPIYHLGKVGIGSTATGIAPDNFPYRNSAYFTKLQVNGSASIGAINMYSDGGQTAGFIKLGFNVFAERTIINNTDVWTDNLNQNGLAAHFLFKAQTGDFLYENFPTGIAGAAVQGVERFRINKDGQFLIGTLTAPPVNTTNVKLAVGGGVLIGTTKFPSDNGATKLAVGGGIYAESVVVKLQANWPDYVFNNNYKLKPLSEVESYINSNKHLPDVSSAAEIEKGGINMAEMDATLLRKIEELTLYVISLEKKVVALEGNK